MKRERKQMNKRGEGGFTLIETSIALVLIMVVGLAISSLLTFAINSNGNAGERATELAIAQQQLEELRGVSFTKLESTVTATGGSPKIVTSAGRNYTVTTNFAYTPAAPATPTLKTVTITVAPQSGNRLAINNPVVLVMQRSTLMTGPFMK